MPFGGPPRFEGTPGRCTDGVLSVGVVTLGVLICGVVTGPTVTGGTVTAGTLTAGTLTVGTLTVGTLTVGTLIVGTEMVPIAYADAGDRIAAAQTGRARRRRRLTVRALTRAHPQLPTDRASPLLLDRKPAERESTPAPACLQRYARPRAKSIRRPSTRAPSTRNPLCSNSLVIHGRAPRMSAAVSSENDRSTYMSSA